jgi:hypothetical protein
MRHEENPFHSPGSEDPDINIAINQRKSILLAQHCCRSDPPFLTGGSASQALMAWVFSGDREGTHMPDRAGKRIHQIHSK